MLPEVRFCINCSFNIRTNDNICPNCEHDQRKPVIKKIADVQTMVKEGFLSTYYNKSQWSEYDNIFNELISSFGMEGNDEAPMEVYNELTIFHIAIQYILTIYHYNNNPKYDELKDMLDSKISQLLMDLWGQDRLNISLNLLKRRITQYVEAFHQDDPIETIAKMVQYIIETIVYFYSNNKNDQAVESRYNRLNSNMLNEIAKMEAFPSIHAFMRCYSMVSSLIIGYKTFLNRWEIK